MEFIRRGNPDGLPSFWRDVKRPFSLYHIGGLIIRIFPHIFSPSQEIF